MGIGGPPATNFNSYYPGGKGGMSGSGGFYQGNSGSPMFGFGGPSFPAVAPQPPFNNSFSPGVPFLNNTSFGPGFMPSPIMPQGMGTFSGTPFSNMYSSTGRFDPYGQTSPLSDPFNRPSFSYPYQYGGGYSPPTPQVSGYDGFTPTWNQPLGEDERGEALGKLTNPGYWSGFQTPRYKYDPSSGKVVPDGTYTFDPRSAYPESNPKFAPGSVADYINSPVLGIGPQASTTGIPLFDILRINNESDYNQPVTDPYEISDFTNTLDQFNLSGYDNYRTALTDYDIAASTPQKNLSALLSSIDPSRGENPFLDSGKLYENPFMGVGVDSYAQLDPERLSKGLLSGNIFNPTRYGEDSTYVPYEMPEDYQSVIMGQLGLPPDQESLAYDFNRDGVLDFSDITDYNIDPDKGYQSFGQDAFGFANEVRRIDSLLPGKLSEYGGSVTDWDSLDEFYASLPKGQQERLFAQGPTRFGDPHTEAEKNKIIERYPEEFSEGWTRGLQDPLGFALNKLGNKAAPYMNGSDRLLEVGLAYLNGPTGFNDNDGNQIIGWDRVNPTSGDGGGGKTASNDRENNNVYKYLSYDALSKATTGYTDYILGSGWRGSEEERQKFIDPETGRVKSEVLDGLGKIHGRFGRSDPNGPPSVLANWLGGSEHERMFNELAEDLNITPDGLYNVVYLPGGNSNYEWVNNFMETHASGLSSNFTEEVKNLSPSELDASVKALQQVDTIEHADFKFDEIDKDQVILQTSRFMSLADPGLTTGSGKWDVGLGSGMLSELSDSGASDRMETLQRQVNRASRGGVSVRQSVNGKISADVVDSSNKFTRTMRNKLYSSIRDSGYSGDDLDLDRLLDEDSGFRAADSGGNFLFNPLDQFETEVLPYVMGVPEHDGWTDQSDLYDSSFQGNATGNFAVVRDFYDKISRQYLLSDKYGDFMSEFDQTVADYMKGAGEKLGSSSLLENRFSRYAPIADPANSSLISRNGRSGYYVPTFYDDDPLSGVSGHAYIDTSSDPSDFYVPGPLGNGGDGMAYGGMASPSTDPIGDALLGGSADGKDILNKFVNDKGVDELLKMANSRIDQGVPFASTVAPSGLDNIPGGMADDVPGIIDGKHPVRLSTGEYVIPADVVNRIGGGDSKSGAEKLMDMVDSIRLSRGGVSQ